MNAEKKIVLITGASSGIGKATALKLLENGHSVYCTARNIDKMEHLKINGGRILFLDVTDEKSIKKAVSKIIEEQGKIDVLFNNAGYGVYGPIEDVPLEEIKRQFDVNVFGIGRMLKAVLPHMRKRKAGLIINTASVAGHLSSGILGWYAATKHAVEAISDALRQEIQHLNIKVVIIEPGIVKTEFDSIAFGLMDNLENTSDYEVLVKNAKKYYERLYEKAEGPEGVAKIVFNAIEAESPSTRYPATPNAQTLIEMRKNMSDDKFDAVILGQYRKASGA
ncbi:MAG: SDR family NAD(P)-dependent oxidoreductase [Candidatus Lokiarchaeota archaeon]|nr:SDR family NAD(P)-dependent oxidoreductase [Candidatus Lokiarchaeota archaeon]